MEKIFQGLRPGEKSANGTYPSATTHSITIALCALNGSSSTRGSHLRRRAIVAGFGRFGRVAGVGNQEPRYQERQGAILVDQAPKHATRDLELAARYGRPIISFVDAGRCLFACCR